MALPNLFGAHKAAQETYFLSLYLTEEFVQATVWGITQSQVEIISRSQAHRYTSVKDVAAKTDEALQELSGESEKTNKVVFGFDAGWIKQTSVTDTHKNLVKAITKELSLEPLGFVSTSESLVQQLISERLQLNAIVVFFHQDVVSLFLIRRGKLQVYVDTPRTDDSIADVREGLLRLVKQADSDEYLPSQLLLAKASLYDEQLTTQQPKLLAYDFGQEQKFVESPVMEVLPVDTVLEAVTKQGGLAVAKLNGLVVTTAPTHTFQLDGTTTSSHSATNQTVESAESVDAVVAPPATDSSASSFGVPIAPHLPSGDTDLNEPDPEFVPIVVKKPHTPKKAVVMGIIVGLLTVLVGGAAALWLYYQVKVTLVLNTIPIADEVKITLDPAVSASDPDKLLLKADLVTKELEDTLTQETTGVKLVGDKAKGTVVLYNKTSAPKTFTKETVLLADKYKFTLNEAVEVASASVSETSGGDGEKREYGKKEVAVTAVEIGATSNITKDTALKVGNFDTTTYAALAKEDFIGGSSREVRVVSADDQQKLQKDLTESLTKKAAAVFKQDSVDGRYIISTGRLEKLVTTFDAPVGKEADTVALTMKIKFEGVEYAKSDVRPLVMAVLGSQVQEGYQLVDTEPEILSSPGQIASGGARVILDANVSSKIKPVVDATTIRDELLGRTRAQAIDHLKQSGKFKSISTTFMPTFTSQVIGKFPQESDRVVVEISE